MMAPQIPSAVRLYVISEPLKEAGRCSSKTSSGQIWLSSGGLGQLSGEAGIIDEFVVLLNQKLEGAHENIVQQTHSMAFGCYEIEVSWFNSCYNRRH
jgi:hypothetical protein